MVPKTIDPELSHSSWPCAKDLYDPCRGGSIVFARTSLQASAEDACEQFQLRSDRWTCSSCYPTIRRLPSHARSPSRNCPHLVLVLLKLSFGILISQRFLPRKGDWSIVDGTPITQCPKRAYQSHVPEGSVVRFWSLPLFFTGPG